MACSSLIRSRPSLPTSRRLITCICVRCGIGIAITFLSKTHAGKVRAMGGHRCDRALCERDHHFRGPALGAVVHEGDGPAVDGLTAEDRVLRRFKQGDAREPALLAEVPGVLHHGGGGLDLLCGQGFERMRRDFSLDAMARATAQVYHKALGAVSVGA